MNPTAEQLIARHFGPLLGQPCWNVTTSRMGMALEFGQPHLDIREPVEPKSPIAQPIGPGPRRRNITLRGDCYLFITAYEWRYFEDGAKVGDTFYRRRLQRAARAIDGQKLTGVAIDPGTARTTFSFDLGGTLETQPLDAESEQWSFRNADGWVLTLRGDGRYCFADERSAKHDWLELAGGSP